MFYLKNSIQKKLHVKSSLIWRLKLMPLFQCFPKVFVFFLVSKTNWNVNLFVLNEVRNECKTVRSFLEGHLKKIKLLFKEISLIWIQTELAFDVLNFFYAFKFNSVSNFQLCYAVQKNSSENIVYFNCTLNVRVKRNQQSSFIHSFVPWNSLLRSVVQKKKHNNWH